MKTNSILVDTGPLVALLNRSDPQHLKCDEVAKTLRPPLFTCWPVITEAAYLLRRNSTAVSTLLTHCNGSLIDILPLGKEDLASVDTIMKNYSDQKFDLADACLMHLATRDEIESVFTLDHRHFSVYRNRKGQMLNLVPQSLA